MKKLLIIALSVLMLLTTGCSQSDNTATTDGPVAITFWHGLGGDRGKFLEEMVQGFNDSQQDVVVTSVYQGTYNDLNAQLQAAISSNIAPDIAQLEITLIPFYMEAEVLLPLDDLLSQETINDMIPGLMNYSYNENDQLVSLPFNRSTPLFYYNKDLFKANGLDPEKGPETFEELQEYARILSDENTKGFGLPVADHWYYVAMVLASGGQLLNDDNTSIGFDGEAGTKALDLLRSMHQEGTLFAAYGKEYNPSELTRSEFVAGRTAMIVQSTGSLTELNKNADFEVGVSFLPKDLLYAVPAGGANIVAIDNNDITKQQATAAFIEYMMSVDNAAAWSIGTGYFPSRQQAVDSEQFQSYLNDNRNVKISIDQLAYGNVKMPMVSTWSEVKSKIGDALEKFWLDESFTSTDAVKLMKESAEKILN